MSIPWQFFGTLSAVTVILVLLGVFAGQRVIDHLERRVSRPLESAVKKAEMLYEKQVDVGAQVDLDLRSKREPFYQDLWRLGGLFPRWPRANDVTYAKVLERSGECRDWFFEGGGMYLSVESRKAYGAVQNGLSRLGRKSDDVVADNEYDSMVQLFHNLRQELATDLLSRSRLRDLSEMERSRSSDAGRGLVSQPPPNGQPAQSDDADQETVQSQLELESAILWQGPALALAAQAFLLTIALGPDGTSFARVISAGLALVTAASALYLVHRKGGEVQDWKDVAGIKESRSGPLASSVWKVALAVFAAADLAIVIMAWSGRPHCWLPAC